MLKLTNPHQVLQLMLLMHIKFQQLVLVQEKGQALLYAPQQKLLKPEMNLVPHQWKSKL